MLFWEYSLILQINSCIAQVVKLPQVLAQIFAWIIAKRLEMQLWLSGSHCSPSLEINGSRPKNWRKFWSIAFNGRTSPTWFYPEIRSSWGDFHGFPLTSFHHLPRKMPCHPPPGWASHGKRPLIQAMRRGTSGRFKILNNSDTGRGPWTLKTVGICLTCLFFSRSKRFDLFVHYNVLLCYCKCLII